MGSLTTWLWPAAPTLSGGPAYRTQMPTESALAESDTGVVQVRLMVPLPGVAVKVDLLFGPGRVFQNRLPVGRWVSKESFIQSGERLVEEICTSSRVPAQK